MLRYYSLTRDKTKPTGATQRSTRFTARANSRYGSRHALCAAHLNRAKTLIFHKSPSSKLDLSQINVRLGVLTIIAPIFISFKFSIQSLDHSRRLNLGETQLQEEHQIITINGGFFVKAQETNQLHFSYCSL